MKQRNVFAHVVRTSMVILVATAGVTACGGDDGDGESSASLSEPAAGQSSGGDAPPVPRNPPPTNSAPTIGGGPPSQVLVGSLFSFTPTAADADGDVLTFSVQNLPSWASFDEGTGRISGRPTEQDLGPYTDIRISVTDGAAVASLPPFAITVAQTASGSATLTWMPPTEKADGSPVDLAGYRVYWGTSSGNYSYSEDVGANVSSYVVDNLTPATWYFAVTALDAAGLESDYSNEATKRIP